MVLSKYDVLRYIVESSRPVTADSLHQQLQSHAVHKRVSKRTVADRLRLLRREKYITDDNEITEAAHSVLACLYWCKLRGESYNDLFHETVEELFRIIFGTDSITLGELVEASSVSKPTVSKYIAVLDDAGFVQTLKKKPLVVKACLTDLSFFFAVHWGVDWTSFVSRFDTPRLSTEETLREELVALHTYSSTVTEGNTATQADVSDVFNNRPVSLTPREQREIQNTREAVEEVVRMAEKPFTLERVRNLHKTLMHTLIPSPGRLYYDTVRVSGSSFDFPSDKYQVIYPLKTLLSFTERVVMRPEILGCLVHFIFVSIHPFQDGNGRMTRLLHSWVLLRDDLSVFAYDPGKRTEYFSLLDESRARGVEGLVQFLLDEHGRLLNDV